MFWPFYGSLAQNCDVMIPYAFFFFDHCSNGSTNGSNHQSNWYWSDFDWVSEVSFYCNGFDWSKKTPATFSTNQNQTNRDLVVRV